MISHAVIRKDVTERCITHRHKITEHYFTNNCGQLISTSAMAEYFEIYVQLQDEEPSYPIILIYSSRVMEANCFKLTLLMVTTQNKNQS
jgi:hypothetical protein